MSFFIYFYILVEISFLSDLLVLDSNYRVSLTNWFLYTDYKKLQYIDITDFCLEYFIALLPFNSTSIISNFIFYFYNYSYTINFKIINMTLKFLVLIALLVFVRGGIPRYRYDFLTKIGWLKLLSIIICFFLSSLMLTYLLL